MVSVGVCSRTRPSARFDWSSHGEEREEGEARKKSRSTGGQIWRIKRRGEDKREEKGGNQEEAGLAIAPPVYRGKRKEEDNRNRGKKTGVKLFKAVNNQLAHEHCGIRFIIIDMLANR